MTDNVNHQCAANSRACFDTEDSFLKLLNVIYFVEEIFAYSGEYISVHEGKKVDGKKQGLLRVTDKESVALEWFDDDLQRGNQIYKLLDEDECTKESKYVSRVDGKYFDVTRAEYTGNMIYN